MLAIEMLDPPYDSIECAIQHQARNVPLGNAKLLVRGLGVAKVQRHPRGSFDVSRANHLDIDGPSPARGLAKLWNKSWSRRFVCQEYLQQGQARSA